MRSDAWRTLVSHAIAGTSRQAPEPPPGFADSSDREGAALASAALLGTSRRAGMRPPLEGPSPPPGCELEVAPVCEAGADHLRRCLERSPDLVTEWLEAARIAGVLVPPLLLPELLEFGVRDAERREAVRAVMGRRGEWLARLNPAWRTVLPIPVEDDASVEERWSTGTRAERLELLRSLRRPDPARARALVEASWSEETAKDRTAFVEAFREGISKEDEPFLEARLTDRSGDVQVAASQMLALLPGSPVARETEALAQELVRRKGASLEVSLPETKDPRLTRIGIRQRAVEGMGERGSLLVALVGRVRPSLWSERLGVSPAQAIALLRKMEHGRALAAGWTEAACLHRDEAWAEALFRWGAISDEGPYREDLIEAISPARLDAALTDLLRVDTGSFLTYRLYGLLLSPRRWSPALSRAVLAHHKGLARQGIQEGGYSIGHPTDYAKRLAPETADEALTGWPEELAPIWENTLQAWREILPLRRAMLETIRRCGEGR